MNKNQWLRVIEVFGGIALLQGAIGILNEFTGLPGGWGLIGHIGFLDGHEVYGSIAFIVLAIAVFAAVEAQRKS
ncbi:hypothetical protein ACFV9W_19225 [Streptomyces sp. NPDC059897]|uniref:hypothetical protein n=1 Tax=Streptomyces sp. NPDC059897 TaxID=3346994 RepID=UPI003658A06E